MDRELYQKLATATKYCQVCEQACELIQSKQEEVRTIKENFPELRWKKTHLKENAFHFCCWLFAVSIVALISTFIYFATDGEDIRFIAPGFIASAVIFVMISLLLLIISRARLKKATSECERIYKYQIEPKITEGLKEIKEIKEEVEKYGETYRHLLDFLPTKYRNFQATSYMLMAVTDQRAETLKEAMNLYEEQLHRWKMEDAVQKNIEMQQYMADAIDELNSRQAETNAHLSAIEQYEFIEYLKK